MIKHINPYLLDAWFKEHKDEAIAKILQRILNKTYPDEVVDEVGKLFLEIENIGHRYPESKNQPKED